MEVKKILWEGDASPMKPWEKEAFAPLTAFLYNILYTVFIVLKFVSTIVLKYYNTEQLQCLYKQPTTKVEPQSTPWLKEVPNCRHVFWKKCSLTGITFVSLSSWIVCKPLYWGKQLAWIDPLAERAVFLSSCDTTTYTNTNHCFPRLQIKAFFTWL